MYEFEEQPKYSRYRGERILTWWLDYLPDEKNPYNKGDKICLELGCLNEYWHTHSSNKHRSYKGVEACNYVQDMIAEEFGQAFLVNKVWAGHQGEKFYRDRTHVTYKYAQIQMNDSSFNNDEGYILITDAHQYYEDVIIFIKKVLKNVMKNHFPGPQYGGRNGEDFFCNYTRVA